MKTFYKILNILTLGFSGSIIEQRRRHSELTEIMNRCHKYEKLILKYVTDNRMKKWMDDTGYLYTLHNYERLSKISKNRFGHYDFDYDEMFELYTTKLKFIDRSFLGIPYFKQLKREKEIDKLL